MSEANGARILWQKPSTGSAPRRPLIAGCIAAAVLLIGGATWYLTGGTDAAAFIPANARPAIRTVAISASGAHTCAVLADGSVRCWGQNLQGALGDGTATDSRKPVVVRGVSGATAVASGFDSGCAITSGHVKCWGRHIQAPRPPQPGDPVVEGQPGRDIGLHDVPGITDAVAVSDGTLSACAIVTGGAVKCWGIGEDGRLGNGTLTSSDAPVNVVGVTGARAIASGLSDTCALISDGTVTCWGEYAKPNYQHSATPFTIPHLTGATAIGVGSDTFCAIVDGGAVKCWGDGGDGQFGNGQTTNPRSAAALFSVQGISDAKAIGAIDHMCVVVAGGEVKCWGRVPHHPGSDDRDHGYTPQYRPAAVPGLTDAVSVTAGGAFTCALLTSGAVTCWGRNERGWLGNGTTTDSDRPVGVTGLS